jgi:hypothetical protein
MVARGTEVPSTTTLVGLTTASMPNDCRGMVETHPGRYLSTGVPAHTPSVSEDLRDVCHFYMLDMEGCVPISSAPTVLTTKI